jgi:hypothetical protein
MASLTAPMWSSSVRSMPPSSRSGAPKSTSHTSSPLRRSARTELISGEMS